jgi:hypothetical protein
MYMNDYAMGMRPIGRTMDGLSRRLAKTDMTVLYVMSALR